MVTMMVKKIDTTPDSATVPSISGRLSCAATSGDDGSAKISRTTRFSVG